jgi:release factor glutamine methyltransferase
MTGATIESCMAAAAGRLKAAGIDEPRREGRLLLAHVLGLDPAAVIGHPEYPVPDRDGFLALVERRARGEPMAHLLGRREFWSLDFRVTSDTLDPRPDSETVVEAALAAVADRRGNALGVLDLGTGTGCLLLAVLSELPRAEGTGVDLSQAAAAVAQENARRLDLADRCRFVVGDWAAALRGRFDLILSNPPYIPNGEIAALQREVARFEPRLALEGGLDGLDSYRRLAVDLPRLLQPGGVAILEVGAGQWSPVAGMMRDAGLVVGHPRADLAGIERCVICHCSEGVN